LNFFDDLIFNETYLFAFNFDKKKLSSEKAKYLKKTRGLNCEKLTKVSLGAKNEQIILNIGNNK